MRCLIVLIALYTGAAAGVQPEADLILREASSRRPPAGRRRLRSRGE